MDTVLIIAVVVLVVVILVDRFRTQQRLKMQIEELTRRLDDRMAGSLSVFGDVREKLGELTKRTRDIEEVGKNISSLQELLRAPKFRGGLGELMLERLLADILPRDNYFLQYRLQSGEAVDAVVRIGGHLVPVDSKFPLEDFERLLRVETEEEQRALRQRFLRAVKGHVDNVAKYIRPDEGTFDFALMYIPAENIYYETILRGQLDDGELYSYALKRRVIPVSPNSLYAYLQVIVQGLRGMHIEQTAREILGHLQRLQGDLGDFRDDYRVIGTHLRNAAARYDEAHRKLSRFEDKLEITCRGSVEELPEEGSEE